MTLEIKNSKLALDGRTLERVHSVDILNISLMGPMEAVIRMDVEIPDIDPEDRTEVGVRVPIDEVNVEYENWFRPTE